MHVDSLHNGKQYITFLPEHASEDYSEINTSGIHAVDISNYGTFSQNRISPHQPLLEELDEKYAESLGNSGDFDIGHGSLVSEAAASYLSTSDKIKRWCSGYWPLIILPVAGVGIFFTAKEWTLGIEDLVEKCRESLEPITHEFAECLESFTQNNIANVIGGALAGTFAGAALQEIVKTPSGRRNEAGWRQRLEQFQTEGGFIIWLFLNYLYRGLWFNEERPRDWVRNLKLQEASIYAANGFLGMIVWHRITALESYEKERREQRRVENDSKPNWWLFCFTAFFLTVSLGFSESKTRRIVQELLMMANASVIGHLGMRRIKERADNGASLAEKTEHFLKVCYPLLPFVSYIFYEKFPSNYARLGSMASLGTWVGMKNEFYKERTIKYIETLKAIVKDGVIISLLGVALTALGAMKLSCSSKTPDRCPLSLGLEAQVVNITGHGLPFALWAMISHMFLRKVCRLKKYQKFEKLTDRYSFEVRALIPYTVFNSGKYHQEYDAYIARDPTVCLVLCGIELGTHLDRLISRDWEEHSSSSHLPQRGGGSPMSTATMSENEAALGWGRAAP